MAPTPLPYSNCDFVKGVVSQLDFVKGVVSQLVCFWIVSKKKNNHFFNPSSDPGQEISTLL